MNEFVISDKLSRLEKEVHEFKDMLEKMQAHSKKESELWDNSDIQRNWKVSERTLASWRSSHKIGYVQVNGKIYYTAEDRRNFLVNNHVEVLERAIS